MNPLCFFAWGIFYMENNMQSGKQYSVDTQAIVTKGKELPHGVVEAIIATDDLDRHNEHVSIKGMKIDKDRTYKVYYNHRTYDDALPIGKYEKIWKKGNELWGRFKLFVDEYPFADQVYKLIQAGGLDSMSVGFIPKEFDSSSNTWTMSDFMEGSVVAEPANVRATIERKQLNIDLHEFETAQKSFEEAQEKSATERALEQIEKLENVDEIKSVYEALKAKTVAVGIAIDGLTQNPTVENVQRVKLHLRSIKGEADTASHIVKRYKLKETK